MSHTEETKVAHHFADANQQFESAKLGMWTFLVQEVLFFSALFVAYIVFRMLHPEMFMYAGKLLDWKMGALNTTILISSSFSMVMAVRCAQTNNRKWTVINLILTFIFAAMFMVVKSIEYSAKFHHGYLPANWFHAAAPFESLHLFFGIYFVMTGLHGLHVLIGMGFIAWLIVRALRGEFNSEYFTPVEMVGLYWHLVDLIWIFLFPLLYLIG